MCRFLMCLFFCILLSREGGSAVSKYIFVGLMGSVEGGCYFQWLYYTGSTILAPLLLLVLHFYWFRYFHWL